MIARRYKALCAAGAVAAAFLAGCSSGSSGTGTSTGTSTASGGGKPAVCASVATLKDDVIGLKDVNVTANGTSAVSAQLTKIQQQLNTVKNDAKGQFSAQVTNLSNALTGLHSSLTAAKDNPSGSTLSAVASAAGKVVTAGNTLVSDVSQTC